MKLITKEIEKQAKKYPLYSQDGKGDESHVWLKFFNPTGAGTWYITEMDIEEIVKQGSHQVIRGTAFGYVTGLGYDELGYIDLEELTSISFPYGLRIERDLYFPENVTLKMVKENHV